MKRAVSPFVLLAAVGLAAVVAIAQSDFLQQETQRMVPSSVATEAISANALPASASHIISVVRCALVDTRGVNGTYGGPRMIPGVPRSFPVPGGPCPGMPAALGYGLIFTAIGPDANTVQLKAWATGAPPPTNPTVTLSKGTAPNPSDTTPRTAAVEASSSGSIDVQVDVGTHLLIEVYAYYTAGVVLNAAVTAPISGGGTGNITLGVTDGSITPAKLNVGGSLNGQVLTSNGSAASWQNPPAGVTGTTGPPGPTGPTGPTGAGTVFTFMTNSATTTIQTTCTNYASGTITITSPSAGSVEVTGDVWVRFSHTTGTRDEGRFVIGLNATDCNGGPYLSHAVVPANAETNSTYDFTVPVRAVFTVAAGTNTYYLNALMLSGQDVNDVFWFANMQAHFYPQ